MNPLAISVCFLLLLVTTVSGDYSCVCNYNVETSVFPAMDTQSTVIGYLYEFDCKQQIELTQDTQGWLVIAFEHKIGFVKQDSQIEIQLCPGDPPSSDVVTTSPPLTSANSPVITSQSTYTTIVMTSPTTTQEPTSATGSTIVRTSTVPTTTTTTTTTQSTVTQTARPTSGPITAGIGDTSLCSQSVKQFAQRRGGIVSQFNDACYVLVMGNQHWAQAELDCNAEGGHLVHISNTAEQNYIYSFLRKYYKHSIWIGLNDKNREAHFEWSSGQTFFFVNWANHTHFSDSFEDCVVMDMHLHDGKWDDRECDFEVYPYICQYAITGSGDSSTQTPTTQTDLASNYTDGNTNLCQGQVSGIVFGQYERSCYELHLTNKMSWEGAEHLCSLNGGHLAHISNAQQQAFVESFMRRHNPDHAVWIGLHDRLMEGTFQWTAGTAVQYTNWIPGHADNMAGGHWSEDCVVLVPQRQGYWDDVHCGYQGLFGFDSGESHLAFCQYKIPSTAPIIG